MPALTRYAGARKTQVLKKTSTKGSQYLIAQKHSYSVIRLMTAFTSYEISILGWRTKIFSFKMWWFFFY